MPNETILERLLAGGYHTDAHWKEFLGHYSQLILKVIWQFNQDHDSAMEKYVYVCERIAANDFDILRRFKAGYGQRPPKFSTWLAAVTRNLCVDAHRKHHGRRQLPRMLRGMSATEQQIFQMYYWKGYSVEDIRRSVESGFAHHPVGDIDVLINRVITLADDLRPRMPRPSFVPFDEQQLAAAETEPDYKTDDVCRRLEQWMQELPSQEKMILRLRFWENMSGREIAETMHIAPEQRVYPLIQNALRHLREKAREMKK